MPQATEIPAGLKALLYEGETQPEPVGSQAASEIPAGLRALLDEGSVPRGTAPTPQERAIASQRALGEAKADFPAQGPQEPLYEEPPASVLNPFSRGVVTSFGSLAALPSLFAELGERLGLAEEVPLGERGGVRVARGIQEWAQQAFPTRKGLEGSFWGEAVLEGAGSSVPLVLGGMGGTAVAARVLGTSAVKAAAISTATAGALQMSAPGMMETYFSQLQKGASPEEAEARALIGAAASAGAGALEGFPGAEVASIFRRAGLPVTRILQLFRRIGGGVAAEESAQEAIQTLIETGVVEGDTEFVFNQTRTILDWLGDSDTWRKVGRGAAVGGVLGLAFGAASAGLSKLAHDDPKMLGQLIPEERLREMEEQAGLRSEVEVGEPGEAPASEPAVPSGASAGAPGGAGRSRAEPGVSRAEPGVSRAEPDAPPGEAEPLPIESAAGREDVEYLPWSERAPEGEGWRYDPLRGTWRVRPGGAPGGASAGASEVQTETAGEVSEAAAEGSESPLALEKAHAKDLGVPESGPSAETETFFGRIPFLSRRERVSDRPGAPAARRSVAEGSLAESRSDALTTRWVDELRSLERLEDAVEQITGGRPRDDYSAHLAAELVAGKSADRVRLDTNRYWKPIVRVLTAEDVSQAQLGRYLLLRAAPGRNARIEAKFGRDQEADPGSGIPTSVAVRELAQMEAGENAETLRRAAEIFDRARRADLDAWVQYGLETQETVDHFLDEEPLYAPMQDDLDEREGGSVLPPGYGTRGRQYQRALGRGPGNAADAERVLAVAMRQSLQTHLRGHRADVGQRLLGLVQEYPEVFEGRVEILSAGDFTKPGQVRIPNAQREEGGPTHRIQRVMDPRAARDPNVVVMRVDGQDVFLRFSDELADVAAAFNRLHGKPLPNFLNAVAAYTRIHSGIQTRWNPAFPLFNFLRDVPFGMIGSFQYGPGFSARIARHVPGSLGALYPHFRTRTTEEQGGRPKRRRFTGALSFQGYEQYLREYQEDGAPITLLSLTSAEEIQKRLQREQERAVHSRRGMAAFLGDTFRWIEDVGNALENATRLATYISARERGESRERAAQMAKSVTGNFERHGSYGRAISALWGFANAGIQGNREAMRALSRSRLVQGAAVGLTALGFTMQQILHHISLEDDDGERFYDKEAYYRKRHNLYIPTGVDESGRPTWLTVPLPFVFRWFYGLGHSTGELMSGILTPGEVFAENVKGLSEELIPLGMADNAGTMISPTILDPWQELWSNKDWRGKPIWPQYREGNWARSEWYYPWVNPTLRSLTSAMNEATGGSLRNNGKIAVSPEWLEHVIDQGVGGAGRTVNRLWKVGEAIVEGSDPDLSHDAPLLRRLVQQPSEFHYAKRFREYSREIDAAYNEVRDMAKAEGSVRARELFEEREAILQLRDEKTARMRALKELEDRERSADTLDEKRRYRAEIRRLLANFNNRAREALRP